MFGASSEPASVMEFGFMARVNDGPHSFTFIHKWNEPYLPLLPSHRASPHFGWYSFHVPLRVGGLVGLE